MDQTQLEAVRQLQSNHSIEADRLADLLDMNDETLKMMVDLYNSDQLNEESRVALEALEAFCNEVA